MTARNGRTVTRRVTRPRPTTGQMLAARGVEVDLGGSMVALRLDWAAVEALERDWGSLKAWADELQMGAEGSMFRAVRSGVAACVRDLPVDARDLMDLALLESYAQALQDALLESGLAREEADEQGNPPGPQTARSPGSSSSSSPSSASESAQTSSGA